MATTRLIKENAPVLPTEFPDPESGNARGGNAGGGNQEIDTDRPDHMGRESDDFERSSRKGGSR